jgi:hypothetical protein
MRQYKAAMSKPFCCRRRNPEVIADSMGVSKAKVLGEAQIVLRQAFNPGREAVCRLKNTAWI